MKFILKLMGSLVVAVIIMLIVFTPPKCEHENMVTVFSFQFQGSTAYNYTRKVCANCNDSYAHPPTRFEGNPADLSYLEAIREHSDGDEIVGGEYYTLTAIVTLGDYDSNRTRINCKVENKDTRVGFSVEFRDEFEAAIDSLQEGDEIIFRGRYYDIGCGFTDSELIG